MLPQERTALTLSFAGVDFCLTPKLVGAGETSSCHTGTAEAMMSISNVCSSEVLINLNGFVGTLRVSFPSCREGCGFTASSHATGSLVANDDSFGEISKASIENGILPKIAHGNDGSSPSRQVPDPVPEDVPSPEMKICTEEKPTIDSIKKTKGQQKLNFFGNPTNGPKKRNGGKFPGAKV